MNVGELISELKQYDPEILVLREAGFGWESVNYTALLHGVTNRDSNETGDAVELS